MQPKVFSASSVAQLEARLDEHITDGYTPSLAVVFASGDLIADELCAPFAGRGLTVFGGSSEEEIAEGVLSTGSIATMLLDVDPDYFRHRIFDVEDSTDLGRKVADWARASFSNPILLLLVGGQGVSIDGDLLLSGIFDVAPGLPVFGGLTSSTSLNRYPPLLSRERVHSDGLSAIVFDNDRIDLRGVAISGWSEVGTPKRITRASGNTVFEIEHMPALDFYQRYFKVNHDEILEAREYPIRLTLTDGTRVMRTAVAMDDENKSVIYGGMIPEGSLVRFCSPNIVETIQHTVEQLQAFRAGSASEASPPPPAPDGVILFDCAIRSHTFGRYMNKELAVIKQLWDVPLVGFSSWGEIGNSPGQACGFHNTTISTVLIHDRDRAAPHDPPRTFSDEQVASFVDAVDPDATVESLKREVAQLRKQKTMLSHFLHLTSEDLEIERRKSDELLLNILPGPVADRLKQGERTIADSADAATILFTDIVGFTALSASMSAPDLVRILNRLFSNFDELAFKYGVEKIKTIGDAYMAVAGLPEPRPDHAAIALKLGKGLLKIMDLFNEKYGTQLQIRVGLNTGPVVAGVIGKRKFSYDLWGDAVNVASRMESNGITGRIHVSQSTYDLLKDTHAFDARGTIEIKGKGQMNTFLYAGS